MRRATSVIHHGTWDKSLLAGTITLLFEDRHKRRIRMRDDEGETFLLDLTKATMLCDGDGLNLEEGGVVMVRAATEKVANIHCRDAQHMARVAWHMGNRHLPLQILGDDSLRILEDRIIIEMIKGLGALVDVTTDTFQPESGAYSHDH